MAATSSSDPLMLKAEGSGGSGETSEGVGVTMVGNSNKDELMVYRGVKKAKKERGCTAKERISKMPPCAAGKRSSIYRGVTRHRWTGRYEAHLWDKSTWNQNQNKKGKQVYLGAYDDEEAAARAYDLAALKYWGPGTLINFPVTDYARDLEEMQNLSREDYLASLRRKSSGFSRGISKYRGVSRWDSSFGHMTGADYYNRVHYGAGEEGTTESENLGGFSMDRKIDLTSYIKWWGHNKTHQTDVHAKSSEETKRGEDISSELKELEWVAGPSEPYQMPRLGVSIGTRHKGSPVSATNILLRSAAYKSLQQKSLKKEEMNSENDENENKTSINKLDYGKAIDKSSSDDCTTEGFGAALGMGGGGLPLQRDAYPLAPFLSAPLLTNYNSISVPLSDPILWTSIAPVLPIRASRAPEVTKTETSSDYTFFQQE